MLPPLPVWNEELRIKTYEADFQRRWRPPAACQALLEAAGNHAANLGAGYPEMQRRNMAWVLSRIKIRFHAYPQVGETLSLRTWPKGIQQKLFFTRDFLVNNEAGDPVVSASSAWLLINLAARRILSPQALDIPLPENAGLSALDETLDKIEMPDGLREDAVVEAGYSAVDLMGHATTARYVEWICDRLPLDEYRGGKIDWLQVNFVHETRPHERVSIATNTPPNGSPATLYFLGTNQTTQLRSFEAALGWSDGIAVA
jgi:acyl-ACP thioesterase